MLRRVMAPSSAVGLFCTAVLILFFAVSALSLPSSTNSSQARNKTNAERKQAEVEKKGDDPKLPTGKEIKKEGKSETKLSQAETIIEFAIIAYGGRKQLETVRAAASEEGTIKLVTDSGDLSGTYIARSMRRDKSWLDLLRVDLDLNAPASTDRSGNDPIKYTVAFNGASVWSAQNGQYITPKPEAEIAFKAQLTHEYMALLRYKEDGSKLEYVGTETVIGVPSNVVDMTTSTGEKTRFWVSSKTFRITHAEYELMLPNQTKATKYRISYFYTPYRVVQNTLVPARREMEQDGKLVQSIAIGPVNYSAKFEPEVFQHLQAP